MAPGNESKDRRRPLGRALIARGLVVAAVVAVITTVVQIQLGGSTAAGAFDGYAYGLWIALAVNAAAAAAVASVMWFLFRDLISKRLTAAGTAVDLAKGDGTDDGAALPDDIDLLFNAIDVMSRRLRENARALEASQQRLTDFAEAASDWLWEMDDELRFSYASDRFYEISGLDPKAFIGRRQDLAAKAEPDSQEWRNHLFDLGARRPFRDFTYGERHPDGHVLWFRLSGRPVFDDDGAFVGYRGTGTDITGEVRAREEAVESTQRFLDAIENVSDGIAFWDAQDRFLLCNRIFRTQAGEAKHLLVRGTRFEDYIRDVLKHTGRDVSPEEEELWVKRRVAERRNMPNAVEVLREGTWLLIRENRSPDGGSVSVTTDVTSLKQREQELQQVTDAVPMLLGYFDKDLHYRLVNRTFEEWFGVKREDILDKSVSDTIAPQTYEKIVPYMEAALEGKNVRFETTLPFFDSSTVPRYAGERHIEATYTPDVNEQGGVEGFFVAANDITERKLTEEQLHQSRKMEAVGQLTGGVAHDFNNLLAVIVGSLNLLEDRVDTEKEHKLVASALMAEVTDANELIEGLIEMLRRTLGVAIEIHTDLGGDLWKMEVDRGQLENALLNLTINARDAMPDGGSLSIETHNVVLDFPYTEQYEGLSPGAYVMIAVSDTGVGMTPETLDHAVEPFFTTKDMGQGSGLGLSMIYGFLRQSGGHMRIYSEVGHGTVVRLYIPTAEGEEIEAESGLDAASGFASRGERILVIEDDAEVRATTLGMLHNLGYDTLEAETGEQALSQLDSEPAIDLVFTDVFLPGGMNGPDIAREIKSRLPDMPILFTSGYSADQISGNEGTDESVQLITKPFEISQLARKLREALDERR